MDPSALNLNREISPEEIQEAMKTMRELRLQSSSSSSSCSEDDDEEDAEEFNHDVDYELFKLNVQEKEESPWCQSFSNTKKEEEPLEKDPKSWRLKQNENLSVTGVLWAMLATMEKQGLDVLESPFLPTIPHVLELATNCQALLTSWHNRFASEGARWEGGPAERLVTMRGSEIGDYKLWLNYYQVEEGARSIMRRLSVGRVMLELKTEAEFNSLSGELEAVAVFLRSAQDLSEGPSLEEAVAGETCKKARAVRLVELKYLLRLKACLVNFYEWLRFIMFFLGEKHVMLKNKTKQESFLDVVVSGELNIRRSALVTSLRLCKELFKEEIVETAVVVSSCSNNILVTDSFVCLAWPFDFLDYSSKGYKMPCLVVDKGDGSYRYITASFGLKVREEDGSEDDKIFDWELSDGRKVGRFEHVAVLGDYVLLRGEVGDDSVEDKKDDKEYSSDESDDETYYGILSISNSEMVVKHLSEDWVEGHALCYGKEGSWVTFMESEIRGKPVVRFWDGGDSQQCLDNCTILASSPYWVILEQVFMSKIVIFNTVEMKSICSQKMTVDETDIVTISQTSSMTNLEFALTSYSGYSKVKIFTLDTREGGRLKEKLKFSLRKYDEDDYLKRRDIMEEMELEIKTHNRHIVVPSPSAASCVLPFKWTVYDSDSNGKRFVEMDSVDDFQMVDDKIMFSFNMSETIVHLSFGLSVEEQVAHDFKMAEKALLEKKIMEDEEA